MAQKNLLDGNVSVCNNDTANSLYGRNNKVRFSDDIPYESDDVESSELMELDFSHERSW